MIPPVAQPRPDTSEIEYAVQCALRTIEWNMAAFQEHYPDDTTIDNIYHRRAAKGDCGDGDNFGWTTSFWPGMLWLVYELTGDEVYRHAAEYHVQSFARRIERSVDLDTHDLGFLYTLACVAPWRLTHNVQARQTAVQAAEYLMTRFLEPAGIIQAWGDLNDPHQRGRTIIDSLMNLPLLYWASEITDDPRFAQAAYRHATQLRDHIIRPDNTTYHTFYWDVETGVPLGGRTEQGYADGSCWARGQAWGIYGFTLSYRYTTDKTFLIAAQRCADYFLDHLPADRVPYWDMIYIDGSNEERDSSAAAIAACGLLELVRWLSAGTRQQRYQAAAEAILASLVTNYSACTHPKSNALLLHGVYDKPKSIGVDEGNLWGDYFYLEALTRALKPDWKPYW